MPKTDDNFIDYSLGLQTQSDIQAAFKTILHETTEAIEQFFSSGGLTLLLEISRDLQYSENSRIEIMLKFRRVYKIPTREPTHTNSDGRVVCQYPVEVDPSIAMDEHRIRGEVGLSLHCEA